MIQTCDRQLAVPALSSCLSQGRASRVPSFRLHLYSQYHFSYKLERRGIFSLNITRLRKNHHCSVQLDPNEY